MDRGTDLPGGDRPWPQEEGGVLYLVATPLGNPGDLSPRASEVLESVDYIAAEDTRRAARLLSSLGIGNRLLSYYEQNKEGRHEQLLSDLKAGRSIAVISDAGMPAISDPGQALVSLAVEQGIRVSVIPGPSAFVSAVAASGFDSSRFVYEGFLPVKGRERKDRLQAMAEEGRTLVFYEAPHRIRKTLEDLRETGLGSRRLLAAREMTKRYEEYLHLTVDEAVQHYQAVEPRGEFTLVLEGLDAWRIRTGWDGEAAWADTDLRDLLQEALDQGLGVRQASQELSTRTGISRRRLYQLALDLEREDDPDR